MYFSRRSVAFTLLELLVALTIIVALTLLSMPAIGPMMSVSSVDSAASMIRAGLMRARNSAVAQQREGFCWLAEGSVVDSGVVTGGVGGGTPIEWTGDEGLIEDFSIKTNLPTLQSSDLYGDAYSSPLDSTPASATWEILIPDGYSGTLQLEAYFKGSASYRGAVRYEVQGTDGDLQTVSDTQIGAAVHAWHIIGNFAFEGGSRTITLAKESSNNRYLWADAVRLTGTLTPVGGASAKSFQTGKSWLVNKWADRYYVVVGAKHETTGDITPGYARIESNTADTITTVTELKDENGTDLPITKDSRFLIHQGDPSSPGGQQTIGSGTDATASWDKLPEGAAISMFDADTDDDDVDDDKTAPAVRRRVFPVVFTTRGRATFGPVSNPSGDPPSFDPGYVTIKIYSREHPDDENLWRYVRLYRNTGRAAVGQKLSDLP